MIMTRSIMVAQRHSVKYNLGIKKPIKVLNMQAKCPAAIQYFEVKVVLCNT